MQSLATPQSARYPAVTPDYLPRLLDRLMQLASTYAVGVPAGLSSPLAGQALFGASGGTLTSTTTTTSVQPARAGGRAAASLCTWQASWPTPRRPWPFS